MTHSTAAALPVAPARRQFVYNGMTLACPDPAMSEEQVREYYAANGYAALTNASVEPGEFDGDMQVIYFRRGTGTKG
jgi:PRTRC genetic system protein C